MDVLSVRLPGQPIDWPEPPQASPDRRGGQGTYVRPGAGRETVPVPKDHIDGPSSPEHESQGSGAARRPGVPLCSRSRGCGPAPRSPRPFAGRPRSVAPRQATGFLEADLVEIAGLPWTCSADGPRGTAKSVDGALAEVSVAVVDEQAVHGSSPWTSSQPSRSAAPGSRASACVAMTAPRSGTSARKAPESLVCPLCQATSPRRCRSARAGSLPPRRRAIRVPFRR